MYSDNILNMKLEWMNSNVYFPFKILPIPELMPFRLTRQIVNLMMPMKIDGLLKNTMVHCLRALRQNHNLLLNTMDVFIKEPSVDWKVSDELTLMLNVYL